MEWDFFFNSDYGKLLQIKVILFVSMILIGAIHDFYIGKKALEDHINNPDPKMRKLASWTGRINLILALAIAYIGVALSRGWY
jgi:putative copper export protein